MKSLGDEISEACAGHQVEDVLNALITQLGAVIAFASDTREAAQRFCAPLGDDVFKAVNMNWDIVKSQEAKAVRRGVQ